MLSLTVAYHNADTAAEKEAIHDQMLAIRADKDNYGDKDTLVEINNESAFDKYMLKAIENGKVSDKELEKALSLIGATTAASTDIYHPSGNSSLIVTDTTTTIGKTDISVNTSALKTKDTDKVVATSSIDVTNHYDAYVFYMPDRADRAKDEVQRIASYYGIDKSDIGTAVVKNGNDLTTAWNTMGDFDDIKIVAINSHANESVLGFDHNYKNNMSSGNISGLEKKNVDVLFLSGCNAGHKDYKYTNPASQFAMVINGGRVIASDGTDHNPAPWFGFGAWKYESVNDTDFQRIRNSKNPKSDKDNPKIDRDNEGWLIYQYTNGEITISSSLGKNLTLKQMLNKLK